MGSRKDLLKILLFGSEGQLGKLLKTFLAPISEVFAFSRKELNICNIEDVSNTIKLIQPNIIINAAAFTNVELAERKMSLAQEVNSSAVKNIADLAKLHKALLIHYSTDYVFDGTKTSAYLETDEPNPINAYGASKLAGEMAIAASQPQHLIFRTSLLVGGGDNCLIQKIISKALYENQITMVTDQIVVPTSCDLVARITAEACLSFKNNSSWPTGVYHVTPNGSTTPHDIAKCLLIFCKNRNLPIKSQAKDVIPITADDYVTLASRPMNSLLNSDKIDNFISFNRPNWKDDFLLTASKIIEEF